MNPTFRPELRLLITLDDIASFRASDEGPLDFPIHEISEREPTGSSRFGLLEIARESIARENLEGIIRIIELLYGAQLAFESRIFVHRRLQEDIAEEEVHRLKADIRVAEGIAALVVTSGDSGRQMFGNRIPETFEGIG